MNRQMATDSERHEPSSSSSTGTPPDEFFARIPGFGFAPLKCRRLPARVRSPFPHRRLLWSHDIGRALRAAHAIEAGWVQVNQGLGQPVLSVDLRR
jgi:hypothetical protein